MKILAVDDDPIILELLPMVAARGGFKDVTTTMSGEHALQMLRNSDVTFDCLLFDVNMPEMDGIELCALARAVEGYAKTPIIMVTAMAEKSIIDRAFAAGATDYVNKPFDVVELGARLRVAEVLIATRRAADGAIGRDQANLQDNALPSVFPLDEEVQIYGVKALIEYSTLRNYLSQLSVTGVVGSQVLAFKIDHVEKIHSRASADKFIIALTEVAQTTYQVMQEFCPMMAYIGNGTFLMVADKPNLERSSEIEMEIQSILDGKNLQYDNGDPLKIVISASNPIRPSTSKFQRVRKTFDRAIARVESRASRK
ncbi:PleD family two-component system response regulator [Pseudorhodobacter sp. W20_MBD10_FR17]|uniref:response regulator n=1 Tax=Pseudorhodobacter sp. W20_MBD10_FR17 TaxID=3240266 RepID=UPI003F9C41DB